MMKLLRELVKEYKRANDIREKELDLKILGPFDYERKWGVYPIQPVTSMVPQVVVAPTHENHATSSIAGKYPW